VSHLPPGRTRRVLLRTGSALVGVLAMATLGSTAPAQATPQFAPASTSQVPAANVCDQHVAPHHAACLALRRTDKLPNTGMALTPNALPSGYGRGDLVSAYNLPSSGGSGQTVAIVDAYDDPNAESDLATYRSTYGLSACTTANGCFKKINQNGGTSYPTADSGWAGEISLDLDMVSATCPDCHILLVEATSANMDDLGAAVNQAVSQGAKFVSNSYGGNEDGSEGTSDSQYFRHPGVAITASSGDGAYAAGTEYPASSQYVTSVGGTALSRSSGTTRGWTESVWKTSSSEGAGSGCSQDVAKPSWQKDTGCAKRMVADVSAVADPATGVAVYQTYGGSGWAVYGGTSASAPIIASVYALAGAPGSSDVPASYAYAHTGNLYDVTSGNNGSCSPSYYCTATAGYDGPTGLGTPNGLGAFTSGGTSTETVSVTNPGSQTGVVGTAVSKQISATDSAGKALTYSATGLPAGLSISSSGLISGTPTTAGTSSVKVTAASGTATGSTTFSWTVNPTGGGGCTAAQLLGNAGFESGTAAPWSVTSGLLNNSSSEPAHAGSWDGWFDGYGSSHTDTASQSVTIPATCTSATLSFFLHIDTAETGSTAYDKFTVQVLNSSGTVLGTLATFSNANAASGYTAHSYNLSSYIGKTVTIKFTGTEDSSLQTSFVLDDNALNVS
jgi:subtilase family serine protease